MGESSTREGGTAAPTNGGAAAETARGWDITVRYAERIRSLPWRCRQRDWKQIMDFVWKHAPIPRHHKTGDTWAPLLTGAAVTLTDVSSDAVRFFSHRDWRRGGVLVGATPRAAAPPHEKAALPPHEKAVLPPQEQAGSPPSAAGPSEADRIDG